MRSAGSYYILLFFIVISVHAFSQSPFLVEGSKTEELWKAVNIEKINKEIQTSNLLEGADSVTASNYILQKIREIKVEFFEKASIKQINNNNLLKYKAEIKKTLEDEYIKAKKAPGNNAAKKSNRYSGTQGCTNADFEEGTTAGWSGSTGVACGDSTPCYNLPGMLAGQHTIVSSGYDGIVGNDLPVVCPGGNYSFRLGNFNRGSEVSMISQSFIVASTSQLFTYKYAVVLEGGHEMPNSSFFKAIVKDKNGNIIPCSENKISGSIPISGLTRVGTSNYYWQNWSTAFVSLSDYIGEEVTVEFTAADCSIGGHLAYAYIDASCIVPEIIASSPSLCSGPITLTAPSGYTYVWGGPGIVGSTTKQTITVNNPGTYYVILTTSKGCKVKLTTTINNNPVVEAGKDVIICPGSSVQLHATGGSKINWSPATGLSDPNSPNPIASPSVTTSYVATSCGVKDTVVVFVRPEFKLTTTANHQICYGSSTSLSTTPDLPGNYIYNWSPSLNLSEPSSSFTDANPGNTCTYYVTVISDSGCVKTDSVKIAVTDKFNIEAVSDDYSICRGAKPQFNIINSGICGTTEAPCSGSVLTGGKTNNYSFTDDGSVSPFAGNRSYRRQLLYTKKDLLQAGLTEKSIIKQIGFYIASSIPSHSYENFTVKAGCTSADLTSNFINQSEIVFEPKTFTLTQGQGWKMITFDKPVAWDGNSNIVIEICYSNSNSAPKSQVWYSLKSNCNLYYGSSNGSVCDASTGTLNNYLPDTKFSFCNSLFPSLNYSWSPGSTLSNPSVSNPTATPPTTTTYTLTAADPSTGCQFTDTVGINVDGDYTITKRDTFLCGFDSVPLFITHNSPYPVTYSWTPVKNISGNNTSNPLVWPDATTTYTVSLTNSQGCIKKDSIKVLVGNKFNLFASASDSMICKGNTVKLNAIFTQPCGISKAACSGTSYNVEIGNSSLAASDSVSITPFTGEMSSKRQFIYTKDELIANSLKPGSLIKSLAFDITNTTSCSSYKNFTIKMTCTSLSSFSGSYIQNTQTVFKPKTVSLSKGWNTFTFDSKYNWDGASNIVIEICFSGNVCGKIAVNNNRSGNNVCLYKGSGTNDMCNMSSGTDSPFRPNIKFSACAAALISGSTCSWSPANSLSSPSVMNPTATPLQNTNYILTITDSLTGCKTSAEVLVAVDDNFTVNAIGDTTLCHPDTVQLNVAATSSSTLTYKWEPNTFLSDPNIQNPLAWPPSGTTYTVTVKASSGCSKKDSVTIEQKGISSSIRPKAPIICKGEPVQLEVTKNRLCGASESKCEGTSSTIQLGNELTKSSAVTATPFTGSKSARRQFILLRSELEQLGLNEKSIISQLGFEITSIAGNNVYENFSISIGCLSDNEFADQTFNASPLIQVYFSKSVILYTGWKMFDFKTSYDWEGGSNILIEICYDNQSHIPGAAGVSYTSAGSNLVLYNTSSLSNVSYMCTFPSGYKSKERPNIKLTHCDAQGGNFNYIWSPPIGLNDPSIYNPTANPSVSTWYKVNVQDPGSGCGTTDSVFVKVVDNFKIEAFSDTTICGGDTIPLHVTHNYPGGVRYTWFPSGSYSSPSSPYTNFYAKGNTQCIVAVTSDSGCVKYDAVKINVEGRYTLNAKGDTTICEGEKAQLNAIISRGCGINGTNSNANKIAQMGTGTQTSSAADITPFSGYKNTKKQLIYTAGELKSQALTGESVITKIGFRVTAASNNKTYDNFTLKISCTDSTTFKTKNYDQGLETVFGPKQVTISEGWFMLDLDKTYDWDGKANIILEISYNGNNNTTHTSVEYSTSMNNVLYSLSNSGNANNNQGVYTVYKPNIRFAFGNEPPKNDLTYNWQPSASLNNNSLINPVATPGTTTTYTLTATHPRSGCIFKDEVKVKIAKPFTVNATENLSICKPGPVPLSVTHTSQDKVSYSWNPPQGLSGTDIANPIATPDVTTTYYVFVTSEIGCTQKDSVQIKVAKPTSVLASASDSSICEGVPIKLSADISRGCGSHGTPCSGQKNYGQIGQSTDNSSGCHISPFCNYKSSKKQILVTRSELAAAGLNKESVINQLAFDVVSGTGLFKNFTIKMGATTQTGLWGNFIQNLQTVFSAKDISILNNGWFSLNLDKTFDWDGSSNIIIELCYEDNPGYSSISVNYSITSFNSVNYWYDYQGTCDQNYSYYYSYRPNLKFGYCKVPVQNTAGYTYSWTPTTNVQQPGSSTTSATPAGKPTYTISITDPLTGCIYKDSVSILAGKKFTVDLPKDTVLCSPVWLYLSPQTNSGEDLSYNWLPSTSFSYPNEPYQYLNPQYTQTYFVLVTANGCTNSDSIKVVVPERVKVNIDTSDIKMCKGKSFTFPVDISNSCGTTTKPYTGAVTNAELTDNSYQNSPFPFGDRKTYKIQMLYRASELKSLGLTAQSIISKIGFENLTVGGTGIYNNFTIKATCTQMTEVSGYFSSNLFPVLEPKTITLKKGWNYFPFDEKYLWDGSSNLLIEIQYSNSNKLAALPSFKNYDVGFYSALETPDITNYYGSYSTKRPFTSFGYYQKQNLAYSWSPQSGINNPFIASPACTPTNSYTYTLKVTDPNSGCVYSDSIKVKVGDDFNISALGDTMLCSPSQIPLSVFHNSDTSVTIAWKPSGNINNPGSAIAYATPTSSINYYVTVTSADGCEKTDAVKVKMPDKFLVNIDSSLINICKGDTTKIMAGISLSCGVSNSICSQNITSGLLGGGIYTYYNIPPFTGYQSSKVQFLYKKEELFPVGIDKPSLLNKISFSVSDVYPGGEIYKDFTIKIGCTSATGLDNTFISGLQTVFDPKPITVTKGITTINFDRSYLWDTTSNIVIEICYDNEDYMPNSALYYSYTSFPCQTRSDSYSACQSNYGYYDYYRPDIKFHFCYSTTPVNSYTWTPSTGLSGSTILTPLASPGSTTSYKLNYTDPVTGCLFKDSVKVRVGENFILSTSNDTIICSPKEIPLIANAAGSGNLSYSWQPSSTVTNSTSSSATGNPLYTTTYTVTVKGPDGCTKKDSIQVKMPTLIEVNAFAAESEICKGNLAGLNSSVARQCGVYNTTLTGSYYEARSGDLNSYSYGNDVTPFTGYKSSRRQILFLKDELTAMGLQKESVLTNLKLYINNASPGEYKNFTIKMGCTDLNEFNALSEYNAKFIQSLQTIFKSNVTPAGGWMNFNFNEPYNWDGNSNIVIEMAYDNNQTLNSSSIYYNNPGFKCSAYTYSYNNSVTNSPSGYFTDARPIIFLGYYNIPVNYNLNYSWQPSASLTTPGSPSTSALINNNTIYTLTVTDPGTGCKFSDTSAVKVNPLPVFKFGRDTILCKADTFYLHTGIKAFTYLWPKGIVDSIFPVTGTGTYWAKVTNEFGCSYKDTISVFYQTPPIANLGNDTVLCEGSSMTLAVNHPYSAYMWQNGTFTDTFNVSTQGTYWVQISNYCGIVKDTIKVDYESPPTVKLGNDTTLCEGSTLQLNPGCPGAYQWNTGSSDSLFPVSSPGTYWVKAVSINGCSNADTININYKKYPVAELGNDLNLCQGEQVVLNVENPEAQYTWQNGSSEPRMIVNSSGKYWVSIKNYCGTITDTVNIKVNPLPVTDAGDDITIMLGTSASLNATGAGQFQWTPEGGLNCTNCANPTASPLFNTTYYLTCTDSNGCRFSDSVRVTVDKNNLIYIPNTFSPNGDGTNDVLLVQGKGIKKIHFVIYDRWGEKVFETEDLNQGWDGTFKGRQMDAAVFVYYLEAEFFSHEKYSYKGDVSLVK